MIITNSKACANWREIEKDPIKMRTHSGIAIFIIFIYSIFKKDK